MLCEIPLFLPSWLNGGSWQYTDTESFHCTGFYSATDPRVVCGIRLWPFPHCTVKKNKESVHWRKVPWRWMSTWSYFFSQRDREMDHLKNFTQFRSWALLSWCIIINWSFLGVLSFLPENLSIVSIIYISTDKHWFTSDGIERRCDFRTRKLSISIEKSVEWNRTVTDMRIIRTAKRLHDRATENHLQ